MRESFGGRDPVVCVDLTVVDARDTLRSHVVLREPAPADELAELTHWNPPHPLHFAERQ
ncbi:hypothetical protein SDC9_173890 [bioreactor metagenome]|uniref:Uncharacterized protein n=1 Tax=bioreactor metagenome TaxID=1076179 RepID=A0A645GIE4_9ZZZZ